MQLLGQLLQVYEEADDHPPCVTGVQVALIDKPDGAFRPIAIFRSLCRVHSRCRSKIMRERAAAALPHHFANAAGRQICDAKYRSHLRCMAQIVAQGAAVRAHAADVRTDIRKAFESVQRHTLWQEGAKHNFPQDILFQSLPAYSLQRV